MITFSFLANKIVKIVYILPFMSKLREIYFDTRTNGSKARRKRFCLGQDSRTYNAVSQFLRGENADIYVYISYQYLSANDLHSSNLRFLLVDLLSYPYCIFSQPINNMNLAVAASVVVVWWSRYSPPPLPFSALPAFQMAARRNYFDCKQLAQSKFTFSIS